MDMPVTAEVSSVDAAHTETPAVSVMPEFAESMKMTRLLCARAYFFGFLASASAIHRITGPAFHAQDPGIGYDKRRVAFHSAQSALLSIAFVLPVALLLNFSLDESRIGEYGQISAIALIIAFLKIAVINPSLARVYFGRQGGSTEFSLPVLGSIAHKFTNWLLPVEKEETHASYFAGERPFVGHGTEINAWTIVVDTSAPANSIHDFAGINPPPTTLIVSELYKAVARGMRALNLEGLRLDWQFFIDGKRADEEKRKTGHRYCRPIQSFSSEQIEEIDKDGSHGRRYMSLTMSKPEEDLIASQFIRFHQNGKLIFCEFASYVLAPGLRRLRRLDSLFVTNWIVYLLAGAGLFAFAAIISSALVFLLGLLIPSLGLIDDPEVFMEMPHLISFGILGQLGDAGYAARAIAVASVLYVLMYPAWRAVRTIFSVVGIWANVSNQFGVAFSYRERFTSRGELEYFALQEIIRFMKTQEKILTKSICDQLKIHNIDSSDFKESVAAYINQGVINSGDIRGNVVSSIKSFVFRRPARSAGAHKQRKAANARS